jgi:hypothetical protein
MNNLFSFLVDAVPSVTHHFFCVSASCPIHQRRSMVDIAGDDEDDHDSIFGTSSSVDDDQQGRAVTPPTASRAGPPIPGLLVFPSLLPEREASEWAAKDSKDRGLWHAD